MDVVEQGGEGALEALVVVRGGLRLNELVLVVHEALLANQHERETRPRQDLMRRDTAIRYKSETSFASLEIYDETCGRCVVGNPVVRGRPEDKLVEQRGEQLAQGLRPERQRTFNSTST